MCKYARYTAGPGLVSAWDSTDNQLFFDTGFGSIRLENLYSLRTFSVPF